MDVLIFKIAVLLSFTLFFVPQKARHLVTLLLVGTLAVVTSYWAVQSFMSVEVWEKNLMYLVDHPVNIIIDKLSAFFILVINLTVITGTLYSKGYLKPYTTLKTSQEMAWHYFNLLWLHSSMLMVVMFRDALAFLIIWELMSLASFFLVIFESEKKETIRIGIQYLIQMHIGLLFILIAFVAASVQSGAPFSFDGLETYFSTHTPFGLFLLFFMGFGIKAGFVPLHTWLPHAHPAASSHVSGIMSGVMIKLGIYGILRVLTYIHTDLMMIGIFILLVSLLTGVLGVTIAIVQRDVKKLLAYSSIENIGIIGTGIGLGVVGMAADIHVLAALGLAGGLLHILNHSLFKSLLFYSSGNIYQQTHTRNIDHLGGMHSKMPRTTVLFLVGSLAICGLPPFNGFVSEFLIYSGLFKSLQGAELFPVMFILLGIIGLAVIGGLAVFCFTKVFSTIFLGTARSNHTVHSAEVSKGMLFPLWMIGLLILFIGCAPFLLMRPLADIVYVFTGHTQLITSMGHSMTNMCIASGVLVVVVGLLWLLRSRVQKKRVIQHNATWGCAYTGANAAVHQYTSASYADNLRQLAPGVVGVKKEFTHFEETEIFPSPRSFATHSSDIFEDNLITKPANKLLKGMARIAVFQTGKTQHYLLYALVFLIVILLLTLVNWI